MTSRKSLYRKNLEEKTIGTTKGGAPVVLYVARVKHDYDSQDEDELDLRVGDIIHCIDEQEDEPDWPEGFNLRLNTIGRFPKNFVEIVTHQLPNEQQARKTIRQSVVGKKPETISVNLSGDAVSVTPYVATVVSPYKHEQLDEHDLVMGEPLLVVAKSRLDEDWLYAKLRGQGEIKLIPGDYVKKSSMTQQQLAQLGPKPAKKSVRMSLTRKSMDDLSKQADSSLKINGDLFYKVIEECAPEYGDELHLKIGDTIKAIKHTEDEGWLVGINQRDHKQGAFCEDFCKKIDAPVKSAQSAPVAKPAINDQYGDLSEGDDGDIYEDLIPEPEEEPQQAAKNKRMSLKSPQIGNANVANAISKKNLPPNTNVKGLWEVVLAHQAEMDDEHTLNIGEIYEAIEDDGEDWWFGRIKGSIGELKAFCTDYMKEYVEPKPAKVTSRISMRKSVQQAKAAAESLSQKQEKPSIAPASPAKAEKKPVAAEKSSPSSVQRTQNENVSTLNMVSLGQFDLLKEENSKLRAKLDEQSIENRKMKEAVRLIEENMAKLMKNMANNDKKCESLHEKMQQIQSSNITLDESIKVAKSELKMLGTSLIEMKNTMNPGLTEEERQDFEKMHARLEKFKNTILAQNKNIADISKTASAPPTDSNETKHLSRRISALEAKFQRH